MRVFFLPIGYSQISILLFPKYYCLLYGNSRMLRIENTVRWIQSNKHSAVSIVSKILLFTLWKQWNVKN